MSEQYRSSLRGPVRGIGSAHEQNQRAAGVPNPEAAARAAGMSPEAFRKQVEEMDKASALLNDMVQDLNEAKDAGVWQTPGNISEQTPEVIHRWHAKMVAARNAAIEEETDQQADEVSSLGILTGMDPEHPLYNPISDSARRNAIEKNLSPLDFDEMVFQGHCDQEVRLRENFSIVFRTLSTSHGMWIEMLLTEMRDSPEQYARHWFSLMQVSASIQSINGKPVGTDLSRFNTEAHRKDFVTAVKAKMEILGRLPSILTDDLIVQYTWFCGRVRKLLAGDLVRKVGN